MKIKFILLLFAVFVLVHEKGGDYTIKYEGQSKPVIGRLMAERGVKWEFISPKKYDSIIKKQRERTRRP